MSKSTAIAILCIALSACSDYDPRPKSELHKAGLHSSLYYRITPDGRACFYQNDVSIGCTEAKEVTR